MFFASGPAEYHYSACRQTGRPSLRWFHLLGPRQSKTPSCGKIKEALDDLMKAEFYAIQNHKTNHKTICVDEHPGFVRFTVELPNQGK
jgi:hypothetical protein